MTADQASIALYPLSRASLVLLLGFQEVFLSLDCGCPVIEHVVYLTIEALLLGELAFDGVEVFAQNSHDKLRLLLFLGERLYSPSQTFELDISVLQS